jgi:hypothetical protein
MRKVFLAFLLAGAAALAAVLPAAADPIGDASPACADIIPSGSAAYNAPAQDTDPSTKGGATATASFNVNGDVANCQNVTYSFIVSWQRDGRTFSRVDSSPDAPSGDFVGVFSVHIPGGISSVCVAVTTSSGSTVLDRSPDAGCIALPANQSPGGDFW